MVTLRPRKSPRVSASRVTPRKRSPSPRPSSSQSTATDVVSVISRLTQQIIEMRTELKEEREERRRFEERILAQRDAALEKVDRLERALETMDRKQRSNNVIIFGLPESPGDLGNAVKSLFQPSGSSLSPNVLDVRRLGRPADAGSNARARPRPVLVQFATSAAKHHAFSCRLRQEKNITLDDDLIPAQRATRESLRPTFQRLKDQQLRPFWRGERLMVVTPQGVKQHRVTPTPAPAPADAPAASA
jgi:hypothetical protein